MLSNCLPIAFQHMFNTCSTLVSKALPISGMNTTVLRPVYDPYTTRISSIGNSSAIAQMVAQLSLLCSGHRFLAVKRLLESQPEKNYRWTVRNDMYNLAFWLRNFTGKCRKTTGELGIRRYLESI